jgi:hypothetical protein
LHHYNISRALLNGAQALFGPFAGGVVNCECPSSCLLSLITALKPRPTFVRVLGIGIRPGLFIGGCSMVLCKPIMSHHPAALPRPADYGDFTNGDVTRGDKNTTFMYIVSYATGTLGCLFWTSWVSIQDEAVSLFWLYLLMAAIPSCL